MVKILEFLNFLNHIYSIVKKNKPSKPTLASVRILTEIFKKNKIFEKLKQGEKPTAKIKNPKAPIKMSYSQDELVQELEKKYLNTGNSKSGLNQEKIKIGKI